MSAPSDFPWSAESLFCVWTWALLRDLEENNKVFKKSADITMSGLEFWNTQSPGTNRPKAAELAGKLDKLLVKGDIADYEAGFDRIRSVAALTEVIATKGATIAELASAINTIYHFTDE